MSPSADLKNVKEQWEAEDIAKTRNAIMAKLSERAIPSKLIGVEEQYGQVFDLLQRVISLGESNSCLLIGPRGSGKTLIVRKALQTLQSMYNDSFITIYLNGFTLPNDRLALREIARQLSLEHELEGKHSFADTLSFVLSQLKSGSKIAKPIIFMLDEFDLFAQHSKQALLYNLFDIAMSNQTPIAVVGMTCRIDAMDLLEKRVKSRFSHRQYCLFPAKSFEIFLQIARNSLVLTTESDLFDNDVFRKIVRRIFDMTRDIRTFYRICFKPVAQLSQASPFLKASHFQSSNEQQQSDSRTQLIRGLSLLEICLLVSIKHLLSRSYSTFNFSMVYDEYKEFTFSEAVKGVGMHAYKWPVALKAFEHLIQMELVKPVEGGMKCSKEYRTMRLMMEPAEVREVVEGFDDVPTSVKRWVQN
ncbi:691_t:CDS:2 [Paraglomus occultum]|uniref:Origin recognition complex subunit 4 n=1 Tax=Paraglomus occultum TaxID=144539 RepID=A0A9N8WBP8_9GLOM|nr:691_t:CDS:2 [Paraglomus occultum]